jgi:hypothetical protein
MYQKAWSTDPSYGTYQHTRAYSQLSRINVFPYRFYFEGDAFSAEPRVNPRRAGWSPEHLEKRPAPDWDPYPDHCFQAACNTTYTQEKPAPPPPAPPGSAPPPAAAAPARRAAGGGGGGACVSSKCINVYR